jgi:hypothetical protein
LREKLALFFTQSTQRKYHAEITKQLISNSRRFTDYLVPAGLSFAPLRLCEKLKKSPADARRFTAEGQSPEGFPPSRTLRKSFAPSAVKGMLFFHAKNTEEIQRRARKEEKSISHLYFIESCQVGQLHLH